VFAQKRSLAKVNSKLTAAPCVKQDGVRDDTRPWVLLARYPAGTGCCGASDGQQRPEPAGVRPAGLAEEGRW
jgi:hypothetical protein